MHNENTYKTYNQLKQYIKDELSGEFEEVTINYGSKKELEQNDNNQVEFTVDLEVYKKLTSICNQYEYLMYVFLLAAFKVMLYKITNIKNICLGLPGYIDKSCKDNIITINSTTVNKESSFRDLLNEVKETTVQGYINHSYVINEALQDNECSTLLKFSKYIIGMDTIHNKTIINNIIESNGYEFFFYFLQGENLTAKVFFNTNIVPKNYIDTLISIYKYILIQTVENQNIKIKDIQVANETEERRIKELNSTMYDINNKDTIDKMFEKQVLLSRNDIALSYAYDMKTAEGEDNDILINKVTYKELNGLSNQLARKLAIMGVKSSDVVGLLMLNSVELVAAMLSILKIGAAFVPIDIDCPIERIEIMAKDSNMKLLLTNCNKLSKLSSSIPIANVNTLEFYNESKDNLNIEKNPDYLAYIIYTSGTTGIPKGVKITHRNVSNFIHWRLSAYQYSKEDISLQLISSSFDASLTNIFPVLLCGGKAVYISNDYWRDTKVINQIIETEKVTNLSIAPSVYKILIDNMERDKWRTIRFIVLGGEQPQASYIKLTKEKLPNILLINEYGPTETTITATAKIGIDVEEINNIGNPIAANSAYIINNDDNILPVGVSGELCISGAGVSSGYINNEQETKNKFSLNPYNQRERLYKTGDIARWTSEGYIEYMGRNDQQVKIRGLRIELNEINNILSSLDYINSAYSYVSKGDYDKIISFVTGDIEVESKAIKENLRGLIPEYMIPAKIYQIDNFPLSSNGKIDQSALEKLEASYNSVGDSKPENQIQQYFCELWSALLNINIIDVNKNFFDIGGNSMLIMLMHNEVEKKYPKILTIPDYFTNTTIKQLSETVLNRIGKDIDYNKQLFGIKMSPEYYADSKNQYMVREKMLSFELPEDIMTKINTRKENGGYRIQSILATAFTYLLSKLSETKEIISYLMLREKNVIDVLDINLNKFADLGQLIEYVENEIPITTILINSEPDIRNNQIPETVTALFCNQVMDDKKYPLSNLFDFIFEISLNMDCVKFTGIFNVNKLEESKVETIIKLYVQIVGQLAQYE